MPINNKLLVNLCCVGTICMQAGQRLVCVVVVSWPTIAPLGGKKPISSVLSISECFCVSIAVGSSALLIAAMEEGLMFHP